MQANLERTAFFPLLKLETGNLLPEKIKLRHFSESNTDFWQLWKQYQDHFYSLCLQWMGGNYIDAEDALTQATLKAWNQWPDSDSKITNPQAWLTQIIHNICIDIHRKRQRERIENIENIECIDHVAVTCSLESPESKILRDELGVYLRHRIYSLPFRVRSPFILHYCQGMSYKDIAKQLFLSPDNVYKRVKQAQSILQKQLKKYLEGEDNTSLDSLSAPLKDVIPVVEKFQSDEIAICDWEAPITTKSNIEELNYQVTVLCLESLSPTCYSYPCPMGWR